MMYPGTYDQMFNIGRFEEEMERGKKEMEKAMKKKTKKSKSNKGIVYVYQDMDHGDVEVFKTLEDAQKHAEKCWPYVEDEDWTGWEESSDGQWNYGEYVSIFMKEIQ